MAEFCLDKGFECIVYDPEGLGLSSSFSGGGGHSLASVEFGHWLENCEAAAELTSNPRLSLVTSGAGAVLAAEMIATTERTVEGIVMAAPSITVFESRLRKWYERELNHVTRCRLESGETLWLPPPLDGDVGPVPLTAALVDSALDLAPDLSRPVDVAGARVIIVHGKRDEVIPYQVRMILRMTNSARSNA